MPKVALVTDSTAYLPPDLLEKYHISVTPQVLIWGDQTFQDGVDIMPDDFYKRLATSKTMPTTSQVAIVTMKDAFEKLLTEGYDVLGIFLSAKLSGTMQSATQAREMLPKAADKITIVDSNSTAMAMGFHVLSVARAAQEGATLGECQKLAEKCRQYTGVFFVVETLEFLRRGGRIGTAQAWVGGALKIKPILTIDREITPVERVRTAGRAFERLVDYLKARQEDGADGWVVQHIQAPGEAERLADRGREIFGCDPVFIGEIGPVIGTHVGPGLLGAGGIPRRMLDGLTLDRS
jgi:DegV family protein with EDD domain